jgi:hypothetical protein
MKNLVNVAPLSIRLPRLPRVSFPLLGIGATINGVSASIRGAICLLERFTVHQRPPVRFTEDGRDPNW